MNRRALLIGAGATVLLLIIWYFLLWSPRQSAISSAADRADAAEAQAQELTVRLTRLKAAQRDEPLKRARLERLRTAVPDDPSLGQLILDVNDAANRSGIDFLSISPAPPAAGAGTGPAEIKLTLSIAGGYFQALDFINRLNALPRLIVVDAVNLGGTGARMAVSITGRAFVSSPTPTTVPGATTTTAAGGAATTTTTVP